MPDNLMESDTKSSSIPVVNIKNQDEIMVLRELSDEERLKEIEDLKIILSNVDSTIEEKNNAYEKLKLVEDLKKTELKLEEKIKKDYNLDSFITINNNQIKVVVNTKNHNYELANNIIRSIQEEYNDKMYISVKFK
jgi:stage III sporulation protein AH